MIFVTLGTQKQQFTRLLDLIENEELLKNEEIIVQAGHTKYTSKFMKIYDFFSLEEMKENIKKSEFVIAHGGVGSIVDSLNEKKKVIAIPRLQKYKEHVDNHQIEICEKLFKDGYIEYINEGESLKDKIKLLRNKEYKEYQKSKEFIKIIQNDIKEFVK